MQCSTTASTKSVEFTNFSKSPSFFYSNLTALVLASGCCYLLYAKQNLFILDVFSNAMGKTIQLRPGKASNNKYFVLLFYKYIFCAVIRLIVSKWCSFALYLFGIMMTLTFSFEAIFKLSLPAAAIVVVY